MWTSLSRYDGSDLDHSSLLGLVEKVFEEGDHCLDCLHCRQETERYEFWGMRGTRVEYCCEVLEGDVSPSQCPGVTHE